MKKKALSFNVAHLGILAVWLGCAASSPADVLLNFPFNEGSGSTTADTASGLTGILGVPPNPPVDYVQFIDTAPSGLPGDRCITNSGTAFLLADDASSRVLDITEGPITMECWTYIDPTTSAAGNQGIAAYGNSYKLGMRGGWLVFTLFGIRDITNSFAPVPAGGWTHLAAAWNPGEGVRFYVNGIEESFQADTTPAARSVSHHYLSILSEGFANNTVMALDRLRIHHALLAPAELDSEAANAKTPLAGTLVSYNFNEPAFPSTNAIAPPLPTILSSTFLPMITSPMWTNDTPAGVAGDFALAFLTTNPPIKEFITVNYGATTINLGANNTNYSLQAWVKLPTAPMEERRVIYRTDGPGPRIALSINANRTLHSTVLGTADFTTSVSVPNDNRWHHVAVVMEDFARLRFYLDGALRQTVNRTQTGAASSGGTARLLIGKESETRYFRGVLDRVIIHNNALTNSTLDFPAVPGLATFDTFAAHPADVTMNAGSNATFTAAPTSSSAAGYQWHYRTNLADHVSIAIPGATSTTLTITNVTATNEGFYFLVVTNEAGRSESYAARLRLTPDLSPKLFDFEPPIYHSGPIDDQDNWTNDQNLVPVLTASEIADALAATGRTPGMTVHSGSQALFVSGGPGVASTTIRAITGLETQSNVTVDVWMRPLGPGGIAAPTGNVFFAIESAAGANGRAAGFRLGPGQSIDYGTAAATTFPWQPTGQLWNENTWYRFTMVLDYSAKTYDFLINGVPANTSPIPFYAAAADSFRQIRIFRGASQAGMIVDDLNITGPPAPTLGIRWEGSNLILFWPASITDYTLQATDVLVPANWTTVPHGVQGNENEAVVQPTGASRFFRLIR